MKVSLANLLCITVLASSGTSSPLERRGAAGKEKKVQYAAWDDVNVLAHGLLQLGQGLKEHVDKTKGQMRDITVKMKVFNVTVSELGKLTQRLLEDSEALKAKAQNLEEHENLVLNMSMDLQEKTEELIRDRKRDQERMNKLEEKVYGMMQGEGLEASNGNNSDVRHIQWMLEAQNKRIDELVERIKQQQEKLDKQNIRIRTLQNQIHIKNEQASLKRKEGDIHLNTSSEQRDSPIVVASDCHELLLRGETTSGLYTIQPSDSQPFEVYCEMTPEGGWTVIQRRQDGSVDFDQLWQAYETGFGNLNGEFWLGLEKIHSMSKAGNNILKVQFSDWRDESQSITYSFRLNGQENNYSLHVLERTAGNLESSLSSEGSGVPFSTRDKDNDQKNDLNCAKQLSGGWWFSNCGRSNLNGRYFVTPAPKQRHQRKQGVFWKTWRGRYYPLKTTTMMIAPAEIENKS
ncbi:angiopoietin-related protein 4 [Triplophysa rosa]|uniref:Angiopoietin-related protein 4 n=1 Tax=Triplophysa rosa TaxID=992332 RepID=A0A9W7WWJ4_TRIRA|nr:angiopoietin-related protein 4 [Triplophysa rosa]KAI7809493.1 angiopoietin-related protein 4 precursor [Triplophysa rosa]